MVSGVLILLLVSATGSRQTFQNERERTGSHPSRYLQDKLQFGKLWQVYLPVMTYGMLYSSMYLGRSSHKTTKRTLLDVTNDLPRVIVDRHPCRSVTLNVTGARWMGQLFYHLTYISARFLTESFRICGLFHVTYIPGSDKEATEAPFNPAEKPLNLSWTFTSHRLFSINLTLSDIVAPNSYGCGDAAIWMNAHEFGHYIKCPNQGPTGVIGTNIKVVLILNYHIGNDARNNKNGQYLTQLSFHYQILNYINYSLQIRMFGAISQKKYGLYVYSNSDRFLNLTKSHMSFVGELPIALVYIYILQARLTPVVFRKNVDCNHHEAELIFYDGILSAVKLVTKELQTILKVWRCTRLSDGVSRNHDNEEIRGSIGALSMLAFVPKADKYKSFYLEVTWQTKHMLPSVFHLRRIELNMTTNKTVHLTPHGTALQVVEIVAPKGKFVHLWFSELKFISSARRLTYNFPCQHGIFIQDPMQLHMHTGHICFNSTAENIVNQYGKNGLLLGSLVIIVLRQYWWMANISTIITASTHHCAGYVNPFHSEEYNYRNRVPAGSVENHGSFVFTNSTSHDFDILVHFQRSSGACAKLQLAHFHSDPWQLPYHAWFSFAQPELQLALLQFTIPGEDLTSPSHFKIDLNSVSNEMQFQNVTSSYTLQLLSLNSASQVKAVQHGVLDAEVYTAQIGVYFSLFTHAAGLTVQVEDGNGPPVCIVERHKGAILFKHVQMSGPCAHLKLYLSGSLTVILNKPYHNRQCCRLEITIAHTQVAHGLLVFAVLHTPTLKLPFIDMWEISGNTLNLKLNILCEGVLAGIILGIHSDRNSTHRMTLAYLASLIERNFVTRDSFIQSRGWNWMCLKHGHCYIMPVRPQTTTWIDAKGECEKKNASLLSINSDSEWNMIIAALLQLSVGSPTSSPYPLIYTGLHTKISIPNQF